MSYCQIIPFKNGLPSHGPEFRNSWGGAARIWSSLFDAYLKNPAIKYHNWLQNTDGLWNLAKRLDLPDFECSVHASTFDLAYVRSENFSKYVHDLREFASKYPVPGCVDHLPAWADWIEKADADAVGFYATSVGENLWFTYDNDKDESVPTPMANGFEVYEWIASLLDNVKQPA